MLQIENICFSKEETQKIMEDQSHLYKDAKFIKNHQKIIIKIIKNSPQYFVHHTFYVFSTYPLKYLTTQPKQITGKTKTRRTHKTITRVRK